MKYEKSPDGTGNKIYIKLRFYPGKEGNVNWRKWRKKEGKESLGDYFDEFGKSGAPALKRK